MGSKEKAKEKARIERQREREREGFLEFRAKAPHAKRLAKHRGFPLQFYDYLDSYEEDFYCLVAEAKQRHPGLVDVHEVDDKTWKNHSWQKLGYDEFEQVLFEDDNLPGDYGQLSRFAAPAEVEIAGFASAFIARDGSVKAGVTIKRNPRSRHVYKEFLYAAKCIALCHELGHVYDYFHSINFDIPNRRANIIEAEAFANDFALTTLANRGHRQGYNMLFDALQSAVPHDDYMGSVSRLVMARHPRREIPDWSDYLAGELTSEERGILGSEGIRALQSGNASR